ncbi:hypothetical protein CPS_1830 [Colwellia psychrerythraea 34H]|uniref:Uncharacterized protein n=1 Tax=Colwellia psychrerythraea (strain 34H / ATCC BAA-681) TaxID=167879 RepID=Q484F5_COLP3|nr:hypothetical protein CPS_1830 [Colwellia psychrerythraea 34H]
MTKTAKLLSFAALLSFIYYLNTKPSKLGSLDLLC